MKESRGGCVECRDRPCIKTPSGVGYCEKHFEVYFQKKVFSTVREFKLIKNGERVVVALSGGKDSVVLLHMLHRLRQKHPFRLEALLIDEGIAGYRAKTIKVAKEECKKLGVRLKILSFEKEFSKKLDKMLKKRMRSGACTYCGVLRRRLINKGSRGLKADKVAIGHNIDDVAQTVLLNMFRNEPDRMLRFGPGADMKKSEGLIRRIQPLIRCSELEIALWAELNEIKIDHISCPYADEAMRQHVRKILNETEDRYHGTKIRLFKSLLGLQRSGEKKKKKKLYECVECSELSSTKICVGCRLLKEADIKV